MPAARYWRAVGLQAVGGGALELSGTVKTYRYLDDTEISEQADQGGGKK